MPPTTTRSVRGTSSQCCTTVQTESRWDAVQWLSTVEVVVVYFKISLFLHFLRALFKVLRLASWRWLCVKVITNPGREHKNHTNITEEPRRGVAHFHTETFLAACWSKEYSFKISICLRPDALRGSVTIVTRKDCAKLIILLEFERRWRLAEFWWGNLGKIPLRPIQRLVWRHRDAQRQFGSGLYGVRGSSADIWIPASPCRRSASSRPVSRGSSLQSESSFWDERIFVAMFSVVWCLDSRPSYIQILQTHRSSECALSESPDI